MKTLLTPTPVNHFYVALCLMSLLASLSACEGTETISPQPAQVPAAQSRRATLQVLTTSTPTACTLVSPLTPATEFTFPALPRVTIGQPVMPRRATY